jgi:hypothetical protein
MTEDAIHTTLRKAKAHFTQHSQIPSVAYCGRNFLVEYCKHVGIPESEVDTIFGECWSEEHGFYILKGDKK